MDGYITVVYRGRFICMKDIMKRLLIGYLVKA